MTDPTAAALAEAEGLVEILSDCMTWGEEVRAIALALNGARGEMRERAAATANMKCRTNEVWNLFDNGMADDAGRLIADRLRALPLTPDAEEANT